MCLREYASLRQYPDSFQIPFDKHFSLKIMGLNYSFQRYFISKAFCSVVGKRNAKTQRKESDKISHVHQELVLFPTAVPQRREKDQAVSNLSCSYKSSNI